MKYISIIGSTGSIGTNTLEVISQHKDKFKVKILVAHKNWQLLSTQSIMFNAEYAVILDEQYYDHLKNNLASTQTKVLCGLGALIDLLKIGQDIIVSALVGIAGLNPTYHSLGNCKILALANKEALICAGEIITKKASITKTLLIPIDSEHNAIHQSLLGQQRHMLKNITLTASGGPFHHLSIEQLKKVTLKEALKHPNWKMGPKITIDSATLFNKGLEFIEAMYLFDLNPEQIDIVIHPQSVIHSMVTYKDGSTIAQLSRPSMQVPISYAINYPERLSIKHQNLNLPQLINLTFYKPDFERFPLLKLAIEAARSGQAAQIVANCANEYAVSMFLEEKIDFNKIFKIVSQALEQNFSTSKIVSLSDVFILQEMTEHYCKKIKL